MNKPKKFWQDTAKVASNPRSSRDLMMCLFAVRKIGKLDLNPKKGATPEFVVQIIHTNSASIV